MLDQLKPHFKGKETLIKLMLIVACLLGIYLLVAWASYSPLDNAWTVASTLTQTTLNKAGGFGAWSIDMLYAMFGKVAVLIPFTLIISSIYVLGMGLSSEMKWKTFCFRLISFLLLMVGLAGLFSVLFSNTAYYLSGGFIGGIWQSVLSETIGQFGALLIAMICTVAGLYFCSAQSLLPILLQFYDWLMAKTEERKSDEVSHNLQSSEQNQPLAAEQETTVEEEKQPQFTDISAFKRSKYQWIKTICH